MSLSQSVADKKAPAYQRAVSIAGIALWLVSTLAIFTGYELRDQLVFLGFIPLIIVVSIIPNTFPLPSGLKYDKITFTLSDAFVLLVACWFGAFPAIFIATIEAFVQSLRTVRRLSSNLFSAGMISLSAAAASLTLGAVLRYGFHGESTGRNHTFFAVTVAMLLASAAHVFVNLGLLSKLFALRRSQPFLRTWKENLRWSIPIFLPTNAVASLMYLALQYDLLVMLIIGAPILLAINFGHRQFRNNVKQRIDLMEKGHRETIEALAVAINAKDEVTHEHVLRVQIYAAGVARILGCTEAEIEALRAGALLHDIGKIAVPDYILNKPGKLTAAEFEKMKLHTVIGAQILGRVDFPYPVVPIVRHHHERWDGKGYPDGLSAEGIPLTARILTVVDCFDALREDRQYRKGMTREEAIDFLLKQSGSQYDPRVVGIFITHLPEFEAEIAAHRDTPLPTFGIEPAEQLSEAALQVAPAAGLAETSAAEQVDQLNFSRRELTSLYELAQSLNGARDAAQATSVFMEKLRALVPYETCAVALASEETGDQAIADAAGQHAALLKGRSIAPGEGVIGWVVSNRQPFFNTDPRLDLPPQLAEHFAAYRTLAVFPITEDKELHGAVALYSSSLAEYDASHQKLLREAVALLSSALSKQTRMLSPEDDAQQPVMEGLLTLLESPSIILPDAPLESELSH